MNRMSGDLMIGRVNNVLIIIHALSIPVLWMYHYHEGKRNVVYCSGLHEESDAVFLSLAETLLRFAIFSSLCYPIPIIRCSEVIYHKPHPARLKLRHLLAGMYIHVAHGTTYVRAHA